jgi:hypothetical protein
MELKRYSNFIKEGKKDPEFYKNTEFIENEFLLTKSNGLSEEEMNENFFTSLLGSLGGGFTDTLKNYITDWAAEKMGIYPFDEKGEPTFFYQVIRNVIEEIHFTEMGKYFGKGSCKNWSKAIVKGLIETIEERGITYLLPKLGLNIDTRGGMGSTITSGLREALTNAINDLQFIKNIEKIISEKICGFNFGDVLSGSNISTADKSKLAGHIEKAEAKDPDIFSKVMKSGLGGLLTGN